MTVDSFEGRVPQIGAGTWVHPSADVVGDVRIGARCWIGPGARLRGAIGVVQRWLDSSHGCAQSPADGRDAACCSEAF